MTFGELMGEDGVHTLECQAQRQMVRAITTREPVDIHTVARTIEALTHCLGEDFDTLWEHYYEQVAGPEYAVVVDGSHVRLRVVDGPVVDSCVLNREHPEYTVGNVRMWHKKYRFDLDAALRKIDPIGVAVEASRPAPDNPAEHLVKVGMSGTADTTPLVKAEMDRTGPYRLRFEEEDGLLKLVDQYGDGHDAYDLNTGNLEEAINTVRLWIRNCKNMKDTRVLHPETGFELVERYYRNPTNARPLNPYSGETIPPGGAHTPPPRPHTWGGAAPGQPNPTTGRPTPAVCPRTVDPRVPDRWYHERLYAILTGGEDLAYNKKEIREILDLPQGGRILLRALAMPGGPKIPRGLLREIDRVVFED